jgi:hypothetical protein
MAGPIKSTRAAALSRREGIATRYLLEGFRVSNPIDGTFSTRMGLEGVQGLAFLRGNFYPDYGHGSAGVLQVHTNARSNTFRYCATNLIQKNDFTRDRDLTSRATIIFWGAHARYHPSLHLINNVASLVRTAYERQGVKLRE